MMRDNAMAAGKNEEETYTIENRYRAIIEGQSELICCLLPDTTLTFVNRAFCEYFDRQSAELIGQKFLAFVPIIDHEMVMKHFQFLHDQHQVDTLDLRVKAPSGEVRWHQWTNRVFVDEQGALDEIHAVGRDITDWKLAEVALERSEATLNTILEAAPIGIGLAQNRIINWGNIHLRHMLGYTEDELLGMSARNFYQSDEEFDYVGKKVIKDIIKNGKGDIETRWRCKDNTIIDVYLQSAAIDPSELSAGIIFSVMDISARKRAEETLQRRTHKLEETNTALKVLLRESGEAKEELERKVMANVKELVLPFFAELDELVSDEQEKLYLSIIKANLQGITSSFTRKLSTEYLGLTPREIQIADLIRQGKMNKEIARLLKITPSAVDFHRRNLRKKFNIKGEKTNLRSFLLSFVG